MSCFADFAPLLKHHIHPQDWHTIQALPITGIATDSRTIKDGEVFALLSFNPNTKHHAKGYIDAINPVVVLSEIAPTEMGYDEQNPPNVPIVHIANLRRILGDFIKAYLYKQPITPPNVIAVTGTNGKTTISQLTAQLLSFAGQKIAVMGTAGNGILGEHGLNDLTPSTHTTLDVLALHRALYDYATKKVDVVCLEASSHGLHQQRLQGVPIQVAIFSNISRDHLDYHQNMADYAHAKAKLFDKTVFSHLTHAIINLDDEFAKLMQKTAKQSGLTVWTYSTKNAQADFFASNITPSLDGVAMTVMTPQGEMTLKSPLLGLFNVSNLLASIGAAMAMGVGFDDIAHHIQALKGASGRMERVPSKTGSFIVDYAHTPDALEQVLKSLKAHCTGQLWAVFGCGGDRDRGKRPLMTQAALKFADHVILTSDNPRSENPNAILKDMQTGLSCADHYKIQIEPDRKLAIQYAVQHAKADDIVVIAGKGHETYQEIQGVRYDFDDRAVLQAFLNQSGKLA